MKTTQSLFQSGKYIFIYGLYWVLTIFCLPSCHKCELLEQEIVYPPKSCAGTFYFNKMASPMDTSFSFNALPKPIPATIPSTYKGGPFGPPTGTLNIPANFSAYDAFNKIYAFEFYSSSNITTGFYANQTAINSSTSSTFTDMYVSPVFANGHLFAINLETIGSDLQYSITEINPITGQDGIGLIGNNVVINSPVDPKYFSSAAANNGLVYFLGSTNLIEYNSVNNSTRYFDIDPTYDPINNLVNYFGLEYDKKQDVLLSIKIGGNVANGFRCTLVSIKLPPSGPQLSQVYDITSNLPSGHSAVINTDFYSTTFDACDTTYYITELNTFNPLTTNFIEIALNRQQLTNRVVDGYWFGLAFNGNE